MPGNWFFYGAALLCCGLFYLSYGQWLGGMVITILLGLPWFNLLLSLPAMVSFRLGLKGPRLLTMGEGGELWLSGSSRLPMPPFRGNIRLKNCITGETRDYDPFQGIPTAHCGACRVTVERARVFDYLGLFLLPIRKKEEQLVLIRPRPVPVENLPDLRRYLARAWRPKAGGGFGENHELRLYRPGDSLNQVHWKLSAKTGNLTIRETMVPQRGLVLLTMTLRGTPAQLDRKFGQLLWLGNHLLGKDIPFQLRVLTGAGIQTFDLAGADGLEKVIDTLLCAPLAREGSIRDRMFAASWQYHIGGGPDVS